MIFVSGAEHRIQPTSVQPWSCPPLDHTTVGQGGWREVEDDVVDHVDVDDGADEMAEHIGRLIVLLEESGRRGKPGIIVYSVAFHDVRVES